MSPRVEDKTGERWGKLKVIAYAGTDQRQRSTWKCQCDCGSSVVVKSANLRPRGTKSCGGCKQGRPRSKPAKKRGKLYGAFGERKTWSEWLGDPRCQVTDSTVRKRLAKGMEFERAISVPSGTKPRAAFPAPLIGDIENTSEVSSN